MKYKASFKSILFSTLTMAAPFCWAGKGGADTGGGNLLGSTKATQAQVAIYIGQSKQVSTYILRRLEYILTYYSDSDLSISMNKKLFHGSKNIYQALAEAQFNVLNNGACIDTEGKEVDASAKDAPSICFSLDRLANKLTTDSLQSEILAIVIHEVSHMVGTTEVEAITLQQAVKNSLANDPFTKIPNLVQAYKAQVSLTIASLAYLRDQYGQLQNEEICSSLLFLGPLLTDILWKNVNSMSDVEKNGISYSSPKYMGYVQGTSLKSLNTWTFCMNRLPTFKGFNESVLAGFKGRNEMSAAEFQIMIHPEQTSMPAPAWIIRQLAPSNREALRLEINDMLAGLTEVLNNI